MGLGSKIDDGFINNRSGLYPCCPFKTPKKELSGEARSGNAVVPKQADDWCAQYRQNDVENQTATNAFEHPTFEADKERRAARRAR